MDQNARGKSFPGPTGLDAEERQDRAFAAVELADLRTEVVQLVAYLLLVPAFLLFGALQHVPDPPETVLWATSWSLAGTTLLTLILLRQGLVPAAVGLIGTLLALCLGEAALFASIIPLFALPLAVVVAGLSLGPAAAFRSAGLAGLATLALPLAGSPAYTARDALWPLLLVVVAAGLTWLGTRPVQIALTYAWNSYSQMMRVTGELREQRAQLIETLKDLSRAYSQLERTSAELARARAAADEARRLKVQFASNISHEMRTPLNLIIGFSEMMLTAPQNYLNQQLPSGFRADVEAIYRNAQHLSALIEDVLELGEVEAGRLGLRKDWAALREILDEATAVVASLFEDKGLTISVDVPEALPALYVDRTRVRQVLINLLNNAVRFTDVGGVHVGARVRDNDVVVTVADTGVGISPRDLPHVFEEFRQLETAYQRHAGGTGLGLAICRKFVELHGGNIQVEGVPGQGTEFTFTLPILTNVASQPIRAPWETWARPPEAQPGDEPLVAVVSADPGPVRLFQRHLDGYQVVEAPDLATTRDGGVHAVIRVLGEGDALEASLQDTTDLKSEVPMLLCRLPSERDLREELGVTDYLVKPFTRERLLAALDRIEEPVRTLLVVDDAQEVVDLIEQTLLAGGRYYHILKAYDGATALDLLRRTDVRVDAVTLDLLMPQPDGFAVLEAMRADERLRDLPVVVVSARGFIDRGVDSSVIAVTRGSRFSIRELMACAQALIQTLERG